MSSVKLSEKPEAAKGQPQWSENCERWEYAASGGPDRWSLWRDFFEPKWDRLVCKREGKWIVVPDVVGQSMLQKDACDQFAQRRKTRTSVGVKVMEDVKLLHRFNANFLVFE